MPIDSKAGNKQMTVGKMQIKGGNHCNLRWVNLPHSPVTLNSQWIISELTWTQGPTINQEADRRGQPKGKSDRAT